MSLLNVLWTNDDGAPSALNFKTHHVAGLSKEPLEIKELTELENVTDFDENQTVVVFIYRALFKNKKLQSASQNYRSHKIIRFFSSLKENG